MSTTITELNRWLPMKVYTSLHTLMKLAYELGQARKSGDEERIREAEKRHDEYRDLCLESDAMVTGITVGELTP